MSGFTRSPDPSLQLRQQYLESLEEPQEFFLEELVGLGQFWTHDDGSYAVTHGKTLVEFFSPNPKNSTSLLLHLHDQDGYSTALVKSYDLDLVRSCKELGWIASVGGFLFRKRETRTRTAFHNVEMSAATPVDVDPLWEVNDDFFARQAEITSLAETGKLWTVRVDGEITGCGVSNRFIEDSDAVDVGMMVAPSLRRRGLGTHIVSEIANRVESAGLRPICGCGASNTASKATLEKAGFVSEHQLLSFTV
ncbi:Protein N-acetyltransferase, RimJ/RimL family [Ruegeria halocynthiae]|uniref:Protein N-acetyltransferase, RimJ/RimL family n=2 Tax=Ruegeria halocynthiae TaxID=985054 RepID=A0A1H3FLL7_9RHOB|nr:Protein N-acetyltransferase, RimJ/RimL family [Ruegeria halocynthiae]